MLLFSGTTSWFCCVWPCWALCGAVPPGVIRIVLTACELPPDDPPPLDWLLPPPPLDWLLAPPPLLLPEPDCCD